MTNTNPAIDKAIDRISWRYRGLDAICQKHTAFKSFRELVTTPAVYRPSIEVIDPDLVKLAEAYDQVMKDLGDDRRAFRYGHRVEPGTQARVWINQGYRTMKAIAQNKYTVLMCYQMPNGRDYYREVTRGSFWGEVIVGYARPRTISAEKASAKYGLGC